MVDPLQDRSPALVAAPAVSTTGHAAAHALDIDFTRSRRSLTPLGVLLLLAGACLATFTALDYEEAGQAVEQVQQQADRLQRAARPATQRAAARQNTETGRDVARLQAQLDNQLQGPLQRPWDAVLRGIERSTDTSVALLSLDAQGSAGTLRLTGEARSMPEVVAYTGRLRALPALRSAELVGHEWREAQGTGPLLRFVLELRWSAQP